MAIAERRNRELRERARQARARALQSQLRAVRLEQINLKLSVLLESVRGEEPTSTRPEPPIRFVPDAAPTSRTTVLTD